MAMVGKDCVAIACDLRLGMQALTVSNNFPKIFPYGDVYLGLNWSRDRRIHRVRPVPIQGEYVSAARRAQHQPSDHGEI